MTPTTITRGQQRQTSWNYRCLLAFILSGVTANNRPAFITTSSFTIRQYACTQLQQIPSNNDIFDDLLSNVIPETETFVSHLECGMTGDKVPADTLQNLSPKGYPLLVRYDLEGVKKTLTKETLNSRAPNWWRYRELLPVRKRENIVSLGETMTPLVPLSQISKNLLGSESDGCVIIKDESRLPTGSFKARGLSLAVSMAKELGVTKIAMPTNGNAGSAFAAYATRAGIESIVFCPEDTPQVNMAEIALQGARLYKVNGLIDECYKFVSIGKERGLWFETSTLKEPYRIEGKKTMGLELAEQLGWELPDAIFYPTGGGTGMIGMWKGFNELEQIGLLGKKRPKMIAVQATGCCPIVKAYEKGDRQITKQEWPNATVYASGIRAPLAIGDFLILDAVRESGGFAIAVTDDSIRVALDEVAKKEGLLLCPEGAATFAAYKEALADGRITKDERVVLFNCGSGLKYPMPPAGIPLYVEDRNDLDFSKL